MNFNSIVLALYSLCEDYNDKHNDMREVLYLCVILFQGWFIRQVGCYTILSGFRLPWPPSGCHYEPTPFTFLL